MKVSIISCFAVCLLTSFTSAQNLRAIDPATMATMMEEDTRIENFRHMERIFPVKQVRRGDKQFLFNVAPRNLSDLTYTFRGRTSTVAEFLEKTTTTNFLVVRNDAIVYEKYFRGNDQASLATSMSVAKSFISALIGIAIDEGHIGSINDPVTKYLPELKESGYNDVPIEHILQMSSGINFSEIYDDETSDILLMMGEMAGGKAITKYAAGLGTERKSGEAFNYASIDTNILGMLIERTTGKDPAAYLEEKIWKKIGMESDATWGTDNHGNVLTFAWLNVTARDYARFARLYLHKGNWNGRQIVPRAWVEASVKPNKEYLWLKDLFVPGWDIGYQYQWWVPHGDEGEFTGIGVWGQYVYVNPAKKLIIVKNSVDPLFDERDQETIAVFRAIGKRW